jgi:Tfp pilus assembly protein PilX
MNKGPAMNHEAMRASNQRGAVLIFSLIMLLLLTLVSVSMIQQNKQELAMAGNALEQTKTLASAETKLKLAEQAIDTARLNPADLNDHKCNSSNLINENDSMGNATVTAVYCLKNDTETQCTFTDGVRDATAACVCNFGTEIYTINLVEDTGSSRRTVESKYAVDCSGGPF